MRANAFAEAIELLARAVAAEPQEAPTQLNLGIALQGAGRHAQAVTCFASVQKLRPDDAASFLRDQPQVALLIARLLAQRLNVATTYLADLMHQYAGHGTHLSMVSELLQSMINLPPSQVSPGSDRQSDPRI